MKNVILQGDVIETLRTLPDGIVHTCVTSPPYWGLRDYGVPGQIGLESTPEEYVEKMVEVFREVRRVLRDDGTLWLNLGDSYASKPCGSIGRNAKVGNTKKAIQRSAGVSAGLKLKDLVGIPWRVAFALQADGWYLRSDIIWNKPNAMPESVKDRPTKAHEYIFLLAKSPRYYYDADAIREPVSDEVMKRYKREKEKGMNNPLNHKYKDKPTVSDGFRSQYGARAYLEKGRNKRTVWSIPTKPFKGAHFAVFPPDLIEPCILAGSPEKACPHCGAPWVRMTERGEPIKMAHSNKIHKAQGRHGKTSVFNTGYIIERITTGWKPTCQCEGNDGSGRGIVLDPFFGSGTTGVVAEKHGRQWIGIELNPEYVEIAKKRLEAGK